jgi:hypothetical protein
MPHACENPEFHEGDLRYREVLDACISDTLLRALKIAAADPAVVMAGFGYTRAPEKGSWQAS